MRKLASPQLQKKQSSNIRIAANRLESDYFGSSEGQIHLMYASLRLD
jgi:hypothetical protein